MNIKQLLQSTSMVKGRGKSRAFQKKFGTILLYNQTVTVRKTYNVVDISMMISGVTDMIKTANGKRPVAYHKATVSIKGLKQTYYSPENLVSYIRLNYKEYENEKEYPAPDVIKIVLNNPSGFFPGSTIFRTTNDADNGFSVIPNKIPEDSEIRVWCSCSDYYWTFQYYNCDNDVDSYGKYPQSYTPKTKLGFEALKKKQPLRNPSKSPGMCKHVMLLLATLMESGIVQEDKSNLLKYYNANYEKFKKKSMLGKVAYENRIAKWRKDQDIKLKQRKIESNSIGYGAKKGYKNISWNKNTHTHKFRKFK